MMFIYNPKAGKSKIRALLADVLEILDHAGYTVTVRPTRRKGDTARLLKKYAEDYDRFVVSGGDGTLHEALWGIRQAAEQGKKFPELGYIPTGSTNDFALSLGIPTDPVRAAKVAAEGDIFPCDCGTFNGHPFAYVAAFGAFTKVSYATPQQTKNSLGHFAYVLEGIKALPQIKGIPLTVQTEDETFSGEYLYGMVSNSNSVGGFNGIYGKTPVALDDGLLEVLLIKEPKTLADQSELMSDLLRINLNSRHIVACKAKKVSFFSEDRLAWTLDGEFGGNHQSVEICAVPDAFRVIIPPKEARQTSQLSPTEKGKVS
jgi:YegS/Rv2252/BmrU family lipid kinase